MIHERVYQLRRLLQSAYEEVLLAGQLVGRSRYKGLWPPELDSHLRVIDVIVRMADWAIGEIIAQWLMDEHIYEVLHHPHAVVHRSEAGLCGFCGSGTEALTYEAIQEGIVKRRAIICPICASLSENPEGGPFLHVDSPAPLRSGERAAFSLAFAGGTGLAGETGGGDRAVLIAALVKDKAVGRTLLRQLRQADVGGGRIEVALQLPEDIRPDLHTARFVAVSDLSIHFARCRFLVR
jgi:hypothetical protein